jgi:osmoprotectant transport system substrate-binding protein
MRSQRRHLLVAAVVGITLLGAACGSSEKKTSTSGGGQTKGTVTIGAFNFPESAILAAMYEGALKADGFTVNVRPNLGNREVVEPALERGEIDMYPGYAATDLEFVNKGAGEASPDVQATVAKLRARLEPKGITALDPSPAIDSNAFAVTKATAEKYHLKTLSDLAPVAGQLVLGGPPECPTRPFCAAGLSKTYGINFKEFKPLDAGGPLSVAALERGDVQVGLIFSSDGAIPAKGFVVLEDDKHLQNADNVVPVIRVQTATPEARTVLNKVSAALTTDDLAALNKRASVDQEDPEVLSQGWLNQHGFTK